MENVNYCQLCTIMISLSFEYGVVNSPLCLILLFTCPDTWSIKPPTNTPYFSNV